MDIMPSQLVLQLITGTLVGVGAAYLGAFMILRRMSLVGDALSHVALPGVAIALIFGINPFAGAFATLFIAIVGVWYLERKTALPSETLIGIFFTLSLAIGLLVTPEPELLEALFGDITQVTRGDAIMSVFAVVAIIAVMSSNAKNMILSIISRDLAKTTGVNINRLNFVFLILVALVVALGIKIAGAILTGSLIIIPAAAAKNIANSMNRYAVWSGVLGGVSTFVGIFAAYIWELPPGPIVIITASIIFAGTILYKNKV